MTVLNRFPQTELRFLARAAARKSGALRPTLHVEVEDEVLTGLARRGLIAPDRSGVLRITDAGRKLVSAS